MSYELGFLRGREQEERTLYMKKTNIARLAVTAGLTLAMGAGMVAPATVAFADPTYGSGSITINKQDEKYTQSFLGYRIFKANVQDNAADTVTGKKESNIDWASDSVKTAVEGVIKAEDKNYAGTTAQDAADWIVSRVTETTTSTHVAGNSVAHKIAEAVKGAYTSGVSLTAGEAKTLDEGYWVFVKDPKSNLADGETGTAPIFAVVGGSAVSVTEKVDTNTIPTPGKKQVNKDDSTGDTDNGGSVAVGDTVTYELSATLPSNIKDYKTYKLEFTDTLSSGLTYKANVRNAKLVKADGTETTLQNPDVTGDATAQTHVFTYADILKLLPSDYSYTAGDKIVFQYDAEVNSNAAAGQVISNQVALTYSNDPNSDGEGTSKDTPKVHEYTYNLILNKVDLGTEQSLSGAKFTVYSKAAKKYIKADGSKVDSAEDAKIEATNGTLTVQKLDAGEYTITETDAPSTEYDKAAAFDINIKPRFKSDGTIVDLTNTMTGRDDLIGGTIDPSSTKGDNKLQAKDDTATNANAGTVTVTVGDKKEITMPLTGMKGTTALMVYGSAILVISAAAYLRHKRNAENDDAE